MKKLCFSFLAIFAALVLVTSCRGRDGVDGRDGRDGRDANVASSTLTVNSSDWRWDGVSYRVDIDYANITQNIIDHGAVLVYMEVSNTWRQLPMTYYYYDGDYDVYCSSSLEVSSYDNGVSIFWTENDMTDVGAPEPHRFKIVVIEASVYAARSDVDFSDYEAVKKAFDITKENNVELTK